MAGPHVTSQEIFNLKKLVLSPRRHEYIRSQHEMFLKCSSSLNHPYYISNFKNIYIFNKTACFSQSLYRPVKKRDIKRFEEKNILKTFL